MLDFSLHILWNIGKRFHLIHRNHFIQHQPYQSRRSIHFVLFTSIVNPLISFSHLLVSFNEPASFANLALLITFTLALVQALLSMIGAVISCLWSPCCLTHASNYSPIINTSSHYVQTTPYHRPDVRLFVPACRFSFLFHMLLVESTSSNIDLAQCSAYTAIRRSASLHDSE